MQILIRISFILCLVLSAYGKNKIAVAVLYFENNSLINKEAYDGLKKGLCDIMITELSKMSGLHVVEREKLAKIMEEIALGQSGAVDESAAPKIGKLLGAQILMFGSYIKDMGRNIRIDTRMVKVETGEVLKAEEITGNAKSLFKLIKKLCFKIAEELDVKVTAHEMKLIKETDKINLDALLTYSEGLELLDSGDKDGALKKFEKTLEMDNSFDRVKQQIVKIKEVK
ncbi:MAG: CsgG/HfaB family protein [bacterium]